MKKSMGCFIPFISLFYLIGFGVVGYGLWSMKRSNDAATWFSAPGTIEKCELKTNRDSEGSDTYQVIVKYRYDVNGREFTNDRLAFGYSGSSSHVAHQQILDKIKTAETVRVLYNPNDPADSVLSYGVHRSIQITLVFGIVWLGFVVGFSLLWWMMSGPDEVLLKNLETG